MHDKIAQSPNLAEEKLCESILVPCRKSQSPCLDRDSSMPCPKDSLNPENAENIVSNLQPQGTKEGNGKLAKQNLGAKPQANKIDRTAKASDTGKRSARTSSVHEDEKISSKLEEVWICFNLDQN